MHIKTWDVEPSVDAVPTRADLSQRKRLPGGGDSPAVVPSSELLDRAVRIWGLYHRGLWPIEEAVREVKYVEQGLPLCESCQLRSGTVWDHAALVCATCKNSGCRCKGCEADRGWEAYRDE